MESERKNVYNEYDLASKRAADEAEYYYPHQIQDKISKGIGDRAENDSLLDLGNTKYIRVKDSLHELYYKELAKKYNISDEQLDSIMIEGVNKHWPSIFD